MCKIANQSGLLSLSDAASKLATQSSQSEHATRMMSEKYDTTMNDGKDYFSNTLTWHNLPSIIWGSILIFK